MPPLQRLPTIRAKLGSTIVFAVGMTVLLVFLLLGYALRNTVRDTERLELLTAARKAAAGSLRTAPDGVRIFVVPPPPASSPPVLGVQGPIPSFQDGQVHVGTTRVWQFATVPQVVGGRVVGMVYAIRPAPGHGLWDRLAATLGFLRSFWWQLLLAGALAGAIALLMARWLARGMTQPLRDMAAAARMMEQGDYSRRVETRSRDEVGQLAAAFNRMSSELQSLEELRKDLVANVSHELKTPISALRAHLENLLDGVEEPDPETLQVMLAQSERLGRLVDQLLDLSRLESGDVPLEREPVALAPLVSEVVSEIQMAGSGRGERPR